MTHNALGKWGEEFAVLYLIEQGYTILERNWFYDKAELDIICQKNNSTLVVVEVKTRNSEFFGDPQSFITQGKIKNIVKATHEYITSHDLDVEVRFDVIAILKNTQQEDLKHFEDAFYHF